MSIRQTSRILIPKSRYHLPTGWNQGGAGPSTGSVGGEGMITDGYTTITTAQQTFFPGNWSNFNATAAGDATAMNIERNWAAAPNEGIANCGYSTFDTGIPFTGGYTKSRLISIVMELDDITNLTVGVGAGGTGNFFTGIYLADVTLPNINAAGTPGFRWGGIISQSTPPATWDHGVQYMFLRANPSATLGTAGGKTTPELGNGMSVSLVMLANGQVNWADGVMTYNDGTGNANYIQTEEPVFGTTWNNGNVNNMIIGCWFAMGGGIAVDPGTFYQMTYTLKYAIVDN